MSNRFSLKSAKSAASKVITVIILFTLFIFNACNEDPTFLGRDLLPSTDDVYTKYYDGTLINNKSSLGKPILTSINSSMLLGSMSDTIFGKSKADFMTRFNIYPIVMGAERDIDSMVLSFRISKVLGDSEFSQTVRVFELIDTLGLDTVYYSDELPDSRYNPAKELAHKEISPDDTIFTIKIVNTELFERLRLAPDSVYNDIYEFWNLFKGLYITTDDVDEGGNIYYLDLEHVDSDMNLYYKDDLTGTKILNMYLNLYSPRVNTYYHDYTNSRGTSFIDSPDQFDTLMFVSSMAGLDSKIFIEGFETWRHVDSLPVAINNAQLFIPVADTLLTGESRENYPAQMLLFTIDENEVFDYIHDYRIDTNGTYFGGFYDAELDAYVFNIGMHLQSYINGEIDDLNLILISVDNATTAERVILNSAHAKDRKMELKITYTKF